jgi:hypothetical protein
MQGNDRQDRQGNKAGLRNFSSRRFLLFLAWLTLIFSAVITFSFSSSTKALGDERITVKKFILQAQHWQLARWGDGSTVCDLYVAHNQPPTFGDVVEFCGYGTYIEWINTPPCSEAAEGQPNFDCDGLLHRYVGETIYTYKKEVEIPKIKIKVATVNCIPGEWCETNPIVKVIAYEPLPGNQILRVNVRVGGRQKTYDGSDGQFPLPITGEQGDWLEYWAESDFGDISERVLLKYRNYQPDPGTSFFHFDLLGTEWAAYNASASLIWEIFPPADRPLIKVLEQPLTIQYLYTTNRYIYLASNLIKAGHVDASECPNNGLYSDGSANPCGEKAAAELVLEWQNRYNDQIFQAAYKHNIPARVLKGILAQETQFWPTSDNPYELGLGKITENGADMLLMWNLDYYLAICSPIYSLAGCSVGYSNLTPAQQTILRRVVLDNVGTPDEIDMLAATLHASGAQVNQIIRNNAQKEPFEITTYEGLWKFTIANYHIGSGCVGVGIENIIESDSNFTWDDLTKNMVGDCKNAKNYVESVVGQTD